EEDLGAWRTEGSGKGAAMTGGRDVAARRPSARPRAFVPAPLGLAVALSGRAGSKTRSARWRGTSRQTARRSRPPTACPAGAQADIGLARVVLECHWRRRFFSCCRRGNSAGDGSLLGIAGRSGGGWSSACPPRDRAGDAVTCVILHTVFDALFEQGVALEGI